MADAVTQEIISFKRDMTLRLSFRSGDFLLWLGYRDIFLAPEEIQCFEIWEMRDGYHLLVTNRLEDLPPWFRLHPTEVCGSFVYKMMDKIEKGDYPSEPMDGPNLWRLKSGDRVAWVGAERPDRRPVNSILAILDCRESALAVGAADWDSVQEFAGFSAPTSAEMNPGDVARCQAAVNAVKKLGLPREWAPEWKLG